MAIKMFRILVINPGSTSTKIGIYENTRSVFDTTIRHSRRELEAFGSILAQKEMRKALVLEALKDGDISLKSLDAIVGRGGMVKPLESGTYTINEKLFEDLRAKGFVQHASALGGIIAYELGKDLAIPAYMVDPVTVDEMMPIAKVTGIKGVERRSIFHALNAKYIAKRFCRENSKEYASCRLIVAHLGGGITVSAHLNGKVVDVSNGLDGEGPLTPERSGALPVSAVIDLCFSGDYTKEELLTLVSSKSGMQMLLGTNDLREAEQRIKSGDKEAELVVGAMAYQVAKEIGAMVAALKSEVNAIIITGGLAHSQYFVSLIERRINKLGKLIIYPGEDELRALTEGVLAVLQKKESAKIYV